MKSDLAIYQGRIAARASPCRWRRNHSNHSNHRSGRERPGSRLGAATGSEYTGTRQQARCE
eukprot:1519021-Amphidinium_carterae.1